LERTSEYFAPELLNRLDSILIFNKLSKESILEVVSLRLKDVADRLRDRRITLDVDDGAKDWLAKKGYSDVYGARAIARVVRTKVGPVSGFAVDWRFTCCSGLVPVGPKNAERYDTVGTTW